MTELRILNLLVWGFMAAYMLTGAYSALFGKRPRRGDPMRLACVTTAVVVCGFSVRGLIAPNDQLSHAVLYVMSIADAMFIVLLGRAYGRGPRV